MSGSINESFAILNDSGPFLGIPSDDMNSDSTSASSNETYLHQPTKRKYRINCQRFACGAAELLIPRKPVPGLIKLVQRHSSMSPAEITLLYSRFRKAAPSGFMSYDEFRQTVGMLALLDDRFLCDRMFRAFDINADNELDFFEFAVAMGTMMKGSEDSKLRLSFRILNPPVHPAVANEAFGGTVAKSRRDQWNELYKISGNDNDFAVCRSICGRQTVEDTFQDESASKEQQEDPYGSVYENRVGLRTRSTSQEDINGGSGIYEIGMDIASFRQAIRSLDSTRRQLVGDSETVDDSVIKSVFYQLARHVDNHGNPQVTLSDYKNAVKYNSTFLALLGVIPNANIETVTRYHSGLRRISNRYSLNIPRDFSKLRIYDETTAPCEYGADQMRINRLSSLDEEVSDSTSTTQPHASREPTSGWAVLSGSLREDSRGNLNSSRAVRRDSSREQGIPDGAKTDALATDRRQRIGDYEIRVEHLSADGAQVRQTTRSPPSLFAGGMYTVPIMAPGWISCLETFVAELKGLRKDLVTHLAACQATDKDQGEIEPKIGEDDDDNQRQSEHDDRKSDAPPEDPNTNLGSSGTTQTQSGDTTQEVDLVDAQHTLEHQAGKDVSTRGKSITAMVQCVSICETPDAITPLPASALNSIEFVISGPRRLDSIREAESRPVKVQGSGKRRKIDTPQKSPVGPEGLLCCWNEPDLSSQGSFSLQGIERRLESKKTDMWIPRMPSTRRDPELESPVCLSPESTCLSTLRRVRQAHPPDNASSRKETFRRVQTSRYWSNELVHASPPAESIASRSLSGTLSFAGSSEALAAVAAAVENLLGKQNPIFQDVPCFDVIDPGTVTRWRSDAIHTSEMGASATEDGLLNPQSPRRSSCISKKLLGDSAEISPQGSTQRRVQLSEQPDIRQVDRSLPLMPKNNSRLGSVSRDRSKTRTTEKHVAESQPPSGDSSAVNNLSDPLPSVEIADSPFSYHPLVARTDRAIHNFENLLQQYRSNYELAMSRHKKGSWSGQSSSNNRSGTSHSGTSSGAQSSSTDGTGRQESRTSSQSSAHTVNDEGVSNPEAQGPHFVTPPRMYMNPVNFKRERQAARRSGSIAQVQNAFARRRVEHKILQGSHPGLAVHFGHESWNMVLNMMVGIRLAAARINHEPTRHVEPYDFLMKEKFSILPRAANIMHSLKEYRYSAVRFIDYAPMVFRKLRESFGLDGHEYMRSVGPEQLVGNMVLGNLSSLSELCSEGKSGAFFYYTADGKFLVKTLTKDAAKFLRSILRDYFTHVMSHKNTMVTRFHGFHAIRLKNENRKNASQKLYFVVMGNIFHTPVALDKRFDLKGSWVGRTALGPSAQDEEGVIIDSSVALKDLDFLNMELKINIGPELKTEFIKTLKSDAEFLRDHSILDYSLLLGIHDINTADPTDPLNEPRQQRILYTHGDHLSPHKVPFHMRDNGGMRSADGKSLFYCGIIDILTYWNAFKKLEHRAKALSTQDAAGISCVHPIQYSERFSRFMESITE